jgi:hypothetical protein
MARIKLIHHINVQTSDRARTREWYETVTQLPDFVATAYREVESTRSR